MFFIKNKVPVSSENPLELEKAKISVFFERVKLSTMLFTAAAILSFGAAIASFILLLTSFSQNTLVAVFGAVFTVLYLALGIVINDYTKRESDFLCKLKRRPLGYLIRSKISTRLIATSATALGLLVFGAVVSFVLYAVKSGTLVLITSGVLLILATVFIVLAYLASEYARRYIMEEIEFFDALETSFAKRTHII